MGNVVSNESYRGELPWQSGNLQQMSDHVKESAAILAFTLHALELASKKNVPQF